MKYLILIPDGMADEPIAELGGVTPMQKAMKPNFVRTEKSVIRRF